MSKQEHARQVLAFIAARGLKVLEPGCNPEFVAWEKSEAKRASVNRSMSKASTGHASRSKWFVKGAGTF